MFFVRKAIIFLALGLIAIFLQGTFGRAFLPALFVPNLLLIFLVFVAFNDVSAFGACIAFLLGLELDLYEGLLLGPWAAAFVAVYGVLATLSQRVFIESPIAAVLAVFSATIVLNLVYFCVVLLFRDISYHGIILSAGEGVVTGIVSPVVLRLLRRWLRRYSREGGRSVMANY